MSLTDGTAPPRRRPPSAAPRKVDRRVHGDLGLHLEVRDRRLRLGHAPRDHLLQTGELACRRRAPGTGRGSRPLAGGGRRDGGRAAPTPAAASTSALTMRPRGPLPLSASRAMPCAPASAPRQRRGARRPSRGAGAGAAAEPSAGSRPGRAQRLGRRRRPRLGRHADPARSARRPRPCRPPPPRSPARPALGRVRSSSPCRSRSRAAPGRRRPRRRRRRARRGSSPPPSSRTAAACDVGRGIAHRASQIRSSGRADDRVGVDAEVAVEVVDVAGLAEVVDPETGDRGRVDGGEERERVRVAVEHGHERRCADRPGRARRGSRRRPRRRPWRACSARKISRPR